MTLELLKIVFVHVLVFQSSILLQKLLKNWFQKHKLNTIYKTTVFKINIITNVVRQFRKVDIRLNVFTDN